MNTPVIKPCRQDRSSRAWGKLCEYIDKLADEKAEEFWPAQEIGWEQIYTLPESVDKLKNIKAVHLYGSKFSRIPPEIGEMEKLEFLDIYSCYNLRWLPYEITNCKNLKHIRISRRVIFSKLKNNNGFPDLTNNPVRYFGNIVKCSICKKEIPYSYTNQLWTSLYVGGDLVPLLINVCSEGCEYHILETTKRQSSYLHKGGKAYSAIIKEINKQISTPKSKRINPV